MNGLILVIALGSVCIILGIAARLGALKRTFIIKGIPGIHPRSLVYALIPTGIFFVSMPLWGSEEFLSEIASFAIFVGLLILMLGSLIWQPRWLKPAWLLWMEDNYGYVLEGMFEEARQMGGRNWEAQVKTQTDLEQWADSVAKRNGWQRQVKG